MKFLRVKYRHIKHIPVQLFIFLPIIPILVLDFFIELYHKISFPIYGYPYIKREEYIVIDRHKLSYLNLRQKLACMYCGYANGVMAYWVRIAGETEKYWCGIKHGSVNGFKEPEHHEGFVNYGDEQEFIRQYKV
ncbi:hypothetical protein ISR92_00715 [Patescibacteria group bacterium]|nr:hypothetical protein [Patescibacteria group bacterium]